MWVLSPPFLTEDSLCHADKSSIVVVTVLVILIVIFILSLSLELWPHLIYCLLVYGRESLVFPLSISKLPFEVFGSSCLSPDSYSLDSFLLIMQSGCHWRVVTGQFAPGHQSTSCGGCSPLLCAGFIAGVSFFFSTTALMSMLCVIAGCTCLI
jgi:hypothetical protein